MMEKLRQLGIGIDDALMPTFRAYEQMLIAREREIRSTRHETHNYGFDPRHQLDVYYPDRAPVEPFQAKPVLVFFYGGGFVIGDRVNEGYAHSLIFGNLGHYFASHFGFTVVIPDYRLMSHGAKYPSGGEDVKLSIDWIVTNLTQQEGYESVDLFLLGNSAGGIHSATYLLAPEFKEAREKITAEERTAAGVLLRGAILLGVPFHWGSEDNATLRGYLGEGKLFDNSPMGLLETAKKTGSTPTLPGVKLSILVSEMDPDLIVDSSKEFKQVWQGSEISFDVLEGHNHLSPQLGLSTGIENEEAWGVQVADFCRSCATK
ncbi:alpha/beta-hydrolase [Xylariaceae sp. FL0662B]|nr:alpha/beta-hydrolase [Xylariaceae sp. FL0662B]